MTGRCGSTFGGRWVEAPRQPERTNAFRSELGRRLRPPPRPGRRRPGSAPRIELSPDVSATACNASLSGRCCDDSLNPSAFQGRRWRQTCGIDLRRDLVPWVHLGSCCPMETDPGPMNTSESDPAREHLFKPAHTPIFRKVPLWIALPAVAIALLLAYQTFGRWYVGSVFVIAILVGSTLLAFGLAWAILRVYRLTTALAIEGDRLVYRSWGRSRSWRLADITKLVQGDVLIEFLKRPDYATQNLMFIDETGQCFLPLGPQWAHTRIAPPIGLALQPLDASAPTP